MENECVKLKFELILFKGEFVKKILNLEKI